MFHSDLTFKLHYGIQRINLLMNSLIDMVKCVIKPFWILVQWFIWRHFVNTLLRKQRTLHLKWKQAKVVASDMYIQYLISIGWSHECAYISTNKDCTSRWTTRLHILPLDKNNAKTFLNGGHLTLLMSLTFGVESQYLGPDQHDYLKWQNHLQGEKKIWCVLFIF